MAGALSGESSLGATLNKRGPWVAFGVACLVYFVSLYPGVGGRNNCGDAAKWQYIGSILGLSHPPGSPLYILLTHVWGKLPVFSLAVRVNLFSAFAGAGAVALLFATARRLGQSLVGAAVAAIFFGLSEAMWTFSTEAEVYATFLFFFAFSVHRAVVWSETRADRDLWILCVAYAAGFGVHYMMITALPALAIFVLATDRRAALRPRNLAVAVAAVALGLLPMVWMWTRIPDAPYSEFHGEHTWRAFKGYLLARQYQKSMFHRTLSFLVFDRSGWALSIVGRQGGIVLPVLACIGGYHLRTRPRVALLLALGALAPFAFLAGYEAGDELGDALPVVFFAALLAGAATDAVGRRADLVVFGLAVFLAALRTPTLFAHRPVDDLTHDTDEIHNYPFDLPCLIEGAEEGTTIVSPFPDYGSRQVALYYRFVDPRYTERHLTLRYLTETPAEWTWAEPQWKPGGAGDPEVAYVFRRDQAKQLGESGYIVTERTFGTLGACGQAHASTVFFRGTRVHR